MQALVEDYIFNGDIFSVSVFQYTNEEKSSQELSRIYFRAGQRVHGEPIGRCLRHEVFFAVIWAMWNEKNKRNFQGKQFPVCGILCRINGGLDWATTIQHFRGFSGGMIY